MTFMELMVVLVIVLGVAGLVIWALTDAKRYNQKYEDGERAGLTMREVDDLELVTQKKLWASLKAKP